VYVLHLPAGPIWALHTFHTVSTGLMLFWYLRYVLIPSGRGRRVVRAAVDELTRRGEDSGAAGRGLLPVPVNAGPGAIRASADS
jgi:hypothetical protein